PAGAGEHAYAMAPGEQFTSHRRTDESRAAREKDLHAGTLAEAFPRAIVRSARQGGGSRLAWLRIGAEGAKRWGWHSAKPMACSLPPARSDLLRPSLPGSPAGAGAVNFRADQSLASTAGMARPPN